MQMSGPNAIDDHLAGMGVHGIINHQHHSISRRHDREAYFSEARTWLTFTE